VSQPKAPLTLSTVLGRVRRNQPLSMPVLVAVNPDAADAWSEEDSTGVTGVQSVPAAWSVEAMSHLAESACLVVDGFAKTGGGLRLTVGRSRRCDYRIADGSVSGVHAYLTYDLGVGEYSVSDAGSRNGTFLNGTRLPPEVRTAVWPGAVLGFGKVVFCFLDPPTVRKLATLEPA
jgi:hypothetical protein